MYLNIKCIYEDIKTGHIVIEQLIQESCHFLAKIPIKTLFT